MIIKIIPETDAEKAKLKKVEHHGVKEFLVFGLKRDEDGTNIEFHDWTGSFTYLIRSLCYFLHRVETEERDQKIARAERMEKTQGKMIKYGDNQPIPFSINDDAPLQVDLPLENKDEGQMGPLEQETAKGVEGEKGPEGKAEQLVKELGIDNETPELRILDAKE